MNKNLNNKLYYISTGIVTFFFTMGSFLYLLRVDPVVHAFQLVATEGFNAIGFPGWLILPLGILKGLGAIAMWAKIPKWIREWAYAGMFFNLSLAVGAHLFNPLNPNDMEIVAAIPLFFVIVSRYTLFKRES